MARFNLSLQPENSKLSPVERHILECRRGPLEMNVTKFTPFAPHSGRVLQRSRIDVVAVSGRQNERPKADRATGLVPSGQHARAAHWRLGRDTCTLGDERRSQNEPARFDELKVDDRPKHGLTVSSSSRTLLHSLTGAKPASSWPIRPRTSSHPPRGRQRRCGSRRPDPAADLHPPRPKRAMLVRRLSGAPRRPNASSR